MTERTFSVTMTEEERLFSLAALGFFGATLPEGEPATLLDGLITKLTRTPAVDFLMISYAANVNAISILILIPIH